MLPSPLNFQTPVVGPNGSGWREEERKRAAEEEAGGETKRAKS
jgi:MADS-box transcription factor